MGLGEILIVVIVLTGVAWLVNDVQAALERSSYRKHRND